MTYNIQGKLKNASEVYNEILFYSYHIGKNPKVYDTRQIAGHDVNWFNPLKPIL